MTVIPKFDTPVDSVVTDVPQQPINQILNSLSRTIPYAYILSGIAFAGLSAGSPLFRMTVGVATLSFLIREVVYSIQRLRHPAASLTQCIAFAKGSFWQNVVIHSGCLLWGLSYRPAHAGSFDSFRALAIQLFPNSTLLIDLFVGAILLLMVGIVMISVVRALLAIGREEPYIHLLSGVLYTILAYGIIETTSRVLLL